MGIRAGILSVTRPNDSEMQTRPKRKQVHTHTNNTGRVGVNTDIWQRGKAESAVQPLQPLTVNAVNYNLSLHVETMCAIESLATTLFMFDSAPHWTQAGLWAQELEPWGLGTFPQSSTDSACHQ